MLINQAKKQIIAEEQQKRFDKALFTNSVNRVCNEFSNGLLSDNALQDVADNWPPNSNLNAITHGTVWGHYVLVMMPTGSVEIFEIN